MGGRGRGFGHVSNLAWKQCKSLHPLQEVAVSRSMCVGSCCTAMHVCRAEEEGLADEEAFAREYGGEMGFESIQEDEFGRIRAVVSTASTQLSKRRSWLCSADYDMASNEWLTVLALHC